ncbi:hypothetical protein [Actinophytocola sediminis]
MFKAIIKGVAAVAMVAGAMMAVSSVGLASPSAAAEEMTVLAGCPGKLVEPIGDINVRARPNTTDGHLGVAKEGAQYPCRIRNITGEEYDACGGSDQWTQIEWEGGVGYVAQRCTRLIG